MDKKGLTLTVIFKAQSLNYGEGIGNISELKKLSRGDGRVYTFASRQAIRYDIARLGNKMFDWNLEVVDKSKGTVQFKENLTIADSEEMDLFGYMKTSKKGEKEDDKGGSDIRSAAVRLSNAISLEEYKSDMEFLSNKGLADRVNEHPNLANIEQHLSYYTYTITIDLQKVGVDGLINLDNKLKAKRVNELLEIIKILNRDIRGRGENLSPLFIIGGIYKMNTPFFLGRIKLEGKGDEFSVSINVLKDTLDLKLLGDSIADDTYIGIVRDVFKNESEISEEFGDKLLNIQDFFEKIETQINEYYK